ncbi:MAG: immunoglobulin-like domain-containing protein [Candidatus Vogelbacteria bacterium]
MKIQMFNFNFLKKTTAFLVATALVFGGFFMSVSPALAADPDTAPNPFSFTDQTNVPLDTVIESNSIIVSGINAATPISVTGGEYSLNGGDYTAVVGTVPYLDHTSARISTVKVRHTSSALNSTAVDTVLTIGGVSDTFTSTTVAAPAPVTLSSIAITTPATKLSYIVGEPLDTTGLVVTGTYSDGSTAIVSPVVVTGFDSSTPVVGQILAVTFEGKTTTYTVDIAATDDDIAPPTVSSYTLNGLAQNVVFNPNDPASVSIVINTDEPVKFNRIKILNSDNDEVKFFTQTGSFSSTATKVWDGKAGGVVVPDGVYTLQVNIKDEAENVNNNLNLTPYTITIETDGSPIPDTTAPVITLLGVTPVNLTVDDAYTDAGATALDNVDGDITANLVVVNPVNTAIVGAYIVTYNVSDAAGNPAVEVIRTVNVVSPAVVTPITQINFTTPARTTNTNTASLLLLVQTRNADGVSQPVTEATILHLRSSSPTGEFLVSGSFWVPVIELTMEVGMRGRVFYYRDSAPGTHTLTVTAEGKTWTPATQEIVVVKPIDETVDVINIEADKWVLISAPKLLSEAPSVTDDGGVMSLLVYRNGAFVVPMIGDDELTNPLSAFYVKTTNAGQVGFKFAPVNPSPTQISKQLNAGWNLVGTINNGLAENEFATLQPEMVALFAPDIYNSRKDTGYLTWGIDANHDLNANPIIALPNNNLSAYDGYWIYMNAAKVFTKNL